jgi:hypothetical protein
VICQSGERLYGLAEEARIPGKTKSVGQTYEFLLLSQLQARLPTLNLSRWDRQPGEGHDLGMNQPRSYTEPNWTSSSWTSKAEVVVSKQKEPG